jgi:hypothetical protein
MFRIEIDSEEVDAREGTFDDGRAWKSRTQLAHVHLPGEKYPIKIKLKLGQHEPYPAGEYTLSPQSFRVFRDKLELKPNLILARPAPVSAQDRKTA